MLTIPELKQKIWEAAGKDLKRVEQAKAACLPFEDTLAYWDRIHTHITLNPLRKPRKARSAPLKPQHWQRYTDAYHAYQAANFPNWCKDGHTLDPRACDTTTANGLTVFICNYITWMGYRATRINVQGTVLKDGTRIPSSTRKGAADISATIKGRSCMFEVKVGRDRPSKQQLEEQARERKAGGEYFFTHTVEEFFMQYDLVFQ